MELLENIGRFFQRETSYFVDLEAVYKIRISHNCLFTQHSQEPQKIENCGKFPSANINFGIVVAKSHHKVAT